MHFRFDHFSKKMLRALVSRRGVAKSEVEVAVDAQRIDVLFVPATGAGPPPPELGLLGRMTASTCILEPFHDPPSLDESYDSIRKLLAWHHLQVLHAGRQARALRLRDRRTPAKPVAPPAQPVMPVLWIISSGRPRSLIDGFALKPLEGWPSGVYAGSQPALPLHLVAVNELPATRETLPLRLMGRGAAQRRAAAELAALPADARERRKIGPLLVKLQEKITKARARRPLTQEEKELLVTGQQLIDAAENRGLEKGLQQGLAKGVQQGLGPLVHQFTRKVGRPLTKREHTAIVRRLGSLGPDRLGDVVLDLEAQALAAWLANPRAR